MPVTDTNLVIRPAHDADQLALIRLAALDCAPVPAAPVLLAEVDGELVAAVSALDGHGVADPFLPSAHVLAQLRVHVDGELHHHRRPRGRTAWRTPRRAYA